MKKYIYSTLFLFLFCQFCLALPNSQCQILQRHITIAKHSLYYDTSGFGTKNILLIHGLFANKNQWHPIMCFLSLAGYKVTAPDLPGYGKSVGYPLNVYALENQVKMLHQFTLKLKMGKLQIAGNSMGGAIAALYTQKYPSQIEGLAFLGAPQGVIGFSTAVKKPLLRGINLFIPVTKEQFLQEMHLLFVKPPKFTNGEINNLIIKYQNNYKHYQQVWNIVNLYMDILHNISINKPTLIIWGKQDRVFNSSGASRLHQAIFGSKLVILPKSGHLLMMERPKKTAIIYLNFLNALDKFS